MSRHRRGQIVDTTASDGLNIREYWTKLFRENEMNFRAQNFAVVLDDDMIAQRMLSAFPNKKRTACLTDVTRARAAYNRGVWWRGARPVIHSYRYMNDADTTLLRVSARGTPMPREPRETTSSDKQGLCALEK